ncbi:MAG: hypothetical protein ACP5OV_07175 [Acidimicrobiales bacterium]
MSVGPPQPTDAVVFLQVNPNGRPTNVVVQYGRTSALGEVTAPASPGTVAAAPTALSITIGGLTPATTHHARAVATNGAGTATSGPLTFTTATGPTGPGAPGAGRPPSTSGTVRVVAAASPDTWGGLSGVACAGGTCLAVGYQDRGPGTLRPLVER